MEAGTEKRRFTKIEYTLILLTFSLCLAGALLLPVNQCPDETGRDYLITWMLERGTLPHPAAVLTLLWLLLFAWACLGTMTKMLL